MTAERPVHDIESIRREYSRAALRKKDLLSDPYAQFTKWLNEAIQANLTEPTAMNLSTVNPDGKPSTRIVLLKGVENSRFIFFTNYDSRKGSDIAANPNVALNFFWPELERQVMIRGVAERIPAGASDRYFDTRPYKARVGAWASDQSKELSSRIALMGKFVKLSLKFAGRKVPRPDHWGGYGVYPYCLEFWQGRPSRLHDRFEYSRLSDQDWQIRRLSP